jgi:hypothetical protein
MTSTEWVEVTPVVDDDPNASFWQPTFKVGDRVRYRYQPECPGVYGLLAPVGHPPEYDGALGVIYEVLAPTQSHPYLIRLDQGSITRSICAASTEAESAA